MVTGGAVAIFYAYVYKKILSACKNIYIRTLVHILDLIIMIYGIHFFIVTKPLV